jgi:hypothetical protein
MAESAVKTSGGVDRGIADRNGTNSEGVERCNELIKGQLLDRLQSSNRGVNTIEGCSHPRPSVSRAPMLFWLTHYRLLLPSVHQAPNWPLWAKCWRQDWSQIPVDMAAPRYKMYEGHWEERWWIPGMLGSQRSEKERRPNCWNKQRNDLMMQPSSIRANDWYQIKSGHQSITGCVLVGTICPLWQDLDPESEIRCPLQSPRQRDRKESQVLSNKRAIRKSPPKRA